MITNASTTSSKSIADYALELKSLREEIDEKSKQARTRLLNEYDQGLNEVTMASDDYRKQEIRFINAFESMKRDCLRQIEALRLECATLKEGK